MNNLNRVHTHFEVVCCRRKTNNIHEYLFLENEVLWLLNGATITEDLEKHIQCNSGLILQTNTYTTSSVKVPQYCSLFSIYINTKVICYGWKMNVIFPSLACMHTSDIHESFLPKGVFKWEHFIRYCISGSKLLNFVQFIKSI